MPANTANRNYTFATSSDANDVALISQRLAEQIDADMTQALADRTWTAYTPALGVNVSLGNGSLSGAYFRDGGLVIATGRLTFGSTTTVTGNIGLGLPFAPNGLFNSQNMNLGSVSLTDQSASAMRFWSASFSSGSTFVLRGPAGETVNATVPWTWANTDIIAWNLSYRVA